MKNEGGGLGRAFPEEGVCAKALKWESLIYPRKGVEAVVVEPREQGQKGMKEDEKAG